MNSKFHAILQCVVLSGPRKSWKKKRKRIYQMYQDRKGGHSYERELHCPKKNGCRVQETWSAGETCQHFGVLQRRSARMPNGVGPLKRRFGLARADVDRGTRVLQDAGEGRSLRHAQVAFHVLGAVVLVIGALVQVFEALALVFGAVVLVSVVVVMVWISDKRGG